jgi:alpha-glucosidase
MNKTQDKDWWRGSVIYQVYPRSFLDTNHNGVGDISGITDRLEYIASLGVDIVWIAPFFTSPMKDFGYDVADYKNVDPMFGSINDFSALIKKANALGLKVMIDLVLSHSSDQHPWFRESRSSRDNDKSDWYVWADPQEDGTPPNNWMSIFGGSAWEWDTTRRQYYMHNFLTSQPDLNYHNPDVVDAVMDVIDYWLRLGVHGFRMDTVNWYYHDKLLRNNPPNTGDLLPYAPESSNYVLQDHIYNKTRPEVLPFLERVRAKLDTYGAMSLGELTAKNANELMPIYTEKDKRVNMVYTFAMLTDAYGADHFRKVISNVEQHVNDGWVCWAFSNHDVMRVVSRWHNEHIPMHQLAKFLLAFLLSLRGSVCMYQGEELGLPEVNVAFEDLQDPYGIRFWPEFKGRDGCRTPMPWHMSMPNGGFSSVKPWLPVPMTHLEKAVDVQEADSKSVLNFARHLLAWRKTMPSLVKGSIRLCATEGDIVSFEREQDGQKILCVFNTGEATREYDLTDYTSVTPIALNAFPYTHKDGVLTLAGYNAFFAHVEQ